MAAEIKNPNYLLNPRYTQLDKKSQRDRFLNREHSRNQTQMLTRAESYDDGFKYPDRSRQKSSVFNPAPYYELIPGMKTSVTDFKKSLYIDKEGNKLNYRPTGKHKS